MRAYPLMWPRSLRLSRQFLRAARISPRLPTMPSSFTPMMRPDMTPRPDTRCLGTRFGPHSARRFRARARAAALGLAAVIVPGAGLTLGLGISPMLAGGLIGTAALAAV